jgi:predicted dehydrogenase
MSKPLNVGMIGYGFMGRTHSNAYRQVSKFFNCEHVPVLKACCARKREKIEEFAKNWGYESYETDWRKLIERKDIDLIDIGSPNNTHKEIVLAAAAAGKMILCEKPLAMNVAEAEEMCAAVEKAGVPNMVWFNYRRVPAISLSCHVLAGLDDRHRRAAGGRGVVAARRRRGRLGRDRRSLGPFD